MRPKKVAIPYRNRDALRIIGIFCIFYSANAIAVSGNITISNAQTAAIDFNGAGPPGPAPGPNSLTITGTGSLAVTSAGNTNAVTFEATAQGPNTVNIQAGGLLSSTTTGGLFSIPAAVFVAPGGGNFNTPVFVTVSGTIHVVNTAGLAYAMTFAEDSGAATFQLNPTGSITANSPQPSLFFAAPNAPGTYSFIFAGGSLTIPFTNNNTTVGAVSVTIPSGANFSTQNNFTTIAAPYSITTNGTFTINNTVSGVSTFTNSNGGVTNLNNILTAQILNNSATFNANNGSTINITTFQNSGIFNLATNFTIAGNQFSNTGTFNNNPGGTLTITGSPLVNNGIFNNNSVVTLGAAHTLQNFGTFNANSGSTFNGLTTLQNFGTFNLAIGLGIAGNNFLNSGTFNINSGGSLTETAGNPLSNNGLLNINSGGVLSAATFNNAGTVNNNSSGSFINTTLNNSGTFNANSGGAFATTNLHNAGLFNLGIPLSIVGSNLSNSGTFNINSGGALALTGNGFINAGTVNLNPGGSFTGTILGNGGASTFNINTNLTTGPNVIIGGPGTPLGIVNLSSGNTLSMNNTMFANTFNNNGILALTNSQILSGNYFQGSGATLMTTIQSGTSTYGQLVVGGLATVGGTIGVNYTNFGIGIADGQTFDIITSNGLTDNNPTIVSQPSLFLTFIRDRNPNFPNNVRIRAVRENPVSDNPSIAGVANTLQFLFGHVNQFPIFLPLLQKIAANPGALVDNLTQLIPIVNGMESIPALYNPYPLFDKILKRANFRRRLVSNQLSFDNLEEDFASKEGYTAGDMIGYNNSFGPIFFGNAISQDARDNIAGYNASTLGLALVGDTPINYYSSVGAGVSYSGTTSKSKCNANTARIDNIQAMVYGSIDYMNAIFLDGVASLGQNYFRTMRTISIVSESAKANFTGLQPSFKARAGINFVICDFELTPLGTVYYSKVKEKAHTEKDALITDLTIQAHRVKLLQFGTGLKLSWIKEAYNFVPEIHALWLKNTKNPQFALTSQFVAGGPPFLAVGPTFPSQGLDVGGSLTMRLSECMLFMGSFDFEFRKQGFLAQTLGLKFRWLF